MIKCPCQNKFNHIYTPTFDPGNAFECDCDCVFGIENIEYGCDQWKKLVAKHKKTCLKFYRCLDCLMLCDDCYSPEKLDEDIIYDRLFESRNEINYLRDELKNKKTENINLLKSEKEKSDIIILLKNEKEKSDNNNNVFQEKIDVLIKDQKIKKNEIKYLKSQIDNYNRRIMFITNAKINITH